jgi:cytochrome b561
MSLKNTTKAWGSLAKFYHWLTVVVLMTTWVAVALHEDAGEDSAEGIRYLLLHKSWGLLLFAVVLARLLWRSSNVTPSPIKMPELQKKAASFVHGMLYLLILAMPITGVIMSQLSGKPVSCFGLFDVPQFIAVNKEMAKDVKALHEDVFFPVLMWFIVGHIGAALFHRFVLKDGLLKRMS